MRIKQLMFLISILFLSKYATADYHDMGGWSNYFYSGGYQIPLTGDFNGDGRADIANFYRGSSGNVKVKLSNQGEFLYYETEVFTRVFWHMDFCLNDEIPLVGDFDNDGLDDVVAFRRGVDPKVFVAISDGTKFGTSEIWETNFCAGTATPLVGDFDGDGWADIASVGSDWPYQVHVAINDHSGGFETAEIWDSFFAPFGRIPMVGDFDGDGRDDIIEFTRGSGADVYVALSNGDSFGDKSRWHSYFCANSEIPKIGDLNGDGKDDILTFTKGVSANVYIAISNGVDEFEGTGVKWHDNFAPGTTIPEVGDFNGFGKADIVSFDGPGGIDDVKVAVEETNPEILLQVQPVESGVVPYLERNDSINSDYRFADFACRLVFINQSLLEVNEIEKLVVYTNNSPIHTITGEGLKATATPATIWATQSDEHLIYRYHKDHMPLTVSILVYARGIPLPLKKVFWTAPHESDTPEGALLFPAKSADLEEGEFWSSNGVHSTGAIFNQGFAYDMGVVKYDGTEWVSKKPDVAEEDLVNSDFYCWEKPVYAMASGTVVEVIYDELDNIYGEPEFPTVNAGGNYLLIQTTDGDEFIKYSHFKNESIEEDFRTVGATVNKGDLLGRCGNSGTSVPHIHVHCHKQSPWSSYKYMRPAPLYGAETIAKSKLPDPENPFGTPGVWQYLDNRGVPHISCLIHPLDEYYPEELPGGMVVDNKPENEFNTHFQEPLSIGRIYPNPAVNQVNVEFLLQKSGNVQLLLYKATGELILTRSGAFYQGVNRVNFDLSGLAEGVYYLDIWSDETHFRKKLVIQ